MPKDLPFELTDGWHTRCKDARRPLQEAAATARSCRIVCASSAASLAQAVYEGAIRGHLVDDALVDEDTAQEALGDAVALWEVRSTFGPGEVIDAATDALLAGVDSPTLHELAGASPRDDYWTLRPLVEDALNELGIPIPAPGTDEMQIAATRVMAKRVINQRLEPSEFVHWVHNTIGHEGATTLQPLVDLDDVWDLTEYTGDTPADLEEAARSMALSLLAGEPLKPPSNVGWRRSTPAQASEESNKGLRSVVRRLRRTLSL